MKDREVLRMFLDIFQPSESFLNKIPIVKIRTALISFEIEKDSSSNGHLFPHSPTGMVPTLSAEPGDPGDKFLMTVIK